MALLCDYFLAADDQQAAAVIEWPAGPSSGAFPTVAGTGIEPVVSLGMFEELLTGRSFHDQLADNQSRPMVANRDGGERLVLRIGDSFVSALSAAEPARLQELAQSWAQIEEFGGRADLAFLAQFLSGLRGLAANAQASGQGLYCWICV